MNKEELSFRDRPINLDEKGSRKWVYAKKPRGPWYRRRTIVSWLVLLFFVAVPFIRINGNPLILLDIAGRKFIIFGVIFWAQDTLILALLMLSFILFIILFTVTFGRLWCGWACPFSGGAVGYRANGAARALFWYLTTLAKVTNSPVDGESLEE